MKIFDKFKFSHSKKENTNQTTQNVNVHNYKNMSEYEIQVLTELRNIHKCINRIFRKVDRVELRVEQLEKVVNNDSKVQHSDDMVK